MKMELLLRRLVFVSFVAFCASSATPELLGHMEPLGKQRPGPEDTIDEYNTSHPLSSERFYNEYMIKRRPVVLRGAAVNWPAFSKWTDEYLNSTYGQMELRLEEKVEGESNERLPPGKYGIGRDSMENFLSGYQSPRANGYIVGELPEPMYKDVDVVPCLACSSIYNKIQEVNFWMTSKGAASAIHRDAFDAINCLLDGKKEWFFMDGKYNDEVYVIHRAKYELGGLSLINPKSVDLKQFPKFADVKYAFLSVNPGDCLFVPSGYYHQVKSPGGRNMAVSILFSKMPRSVEVNTCSPEPEHSKPLDEAGVYLQYPGTGIMTMGVLDFEMFRGIVNNFTLQNGGRFTPSVLLKALADIEAPAEGYETGINLEADPERRRITKRVFSVLSKGKQRWLSLAELEDIPTETWQEAISIMEPPDPSNTYDFEFTVIDPQQLSEAVDGFFVLRKTMSREQWSILYTDVIHGSEYMASRIFDQINPDRKDTLDEAEFREKFEGVVEQFQSEDQRLEISTNETELIRHRAHGADGEDAEDNRGDRDDGDDSDNGDNNDDGDDDDDDDGGVPDDDDDDDGGVPDNDDDDASSEAQHTEL